MSDNPLIDTPERIDRIRTRAHQLWEEEGRPHGRDEEMWERAEFLVRLEESAGAAQLPNPSTQNDPNPGITVEDARIQENYGEFPDRFADQGDWRQTPMTRDQMRTQQQDHEPGRGDAP